jgi:hypothetical protein
VITEFDWTRKYKSALLERNPILQKRRIVEARNAMTRRSSEIEVSLSERKLIHRALDILASLREVQEPLDS